MSVSSNILIGGGTGFVGSHLVKVLKSNGYGTTIISRMPGPQRISWCDLQTKGLPKGTTAVVNLAGQNVMDFTRRWTPGFKQNVFNSRINTTTSLARAINNAIIKPSVFITMSGVGCYKSDKEVEYTEESLCSEFDFFSNLCSKWEKAASLSLESGNNCRVVTIRSGVVLGRNGGMIKELYLPFSLGLGGPIGNGSQYLPWIHIDDLINFMIYAIENSKVEGIFNGVAPQPCTNKEFSDAFGKVLRRPAILRTPTFVFNLLLSKERAQMITEGQKVLPKRTLSTGFKYQYSDIASACRAVVKSN